MAWTMAFGILTFVYACVVGLLVIIYRRGRSNIDLSQAIPLARRHRGLLAVYGIVWVVASVVFNPVLGCLVLGLPAILGMFLVVILVGGASGSKAIRNYTPTMAEGDKSLTILALRYLVIPPLAWWAVALPAATLFLLLGGVGFVKFNTVFPGRWQGDNGTVLDIRTNGSTSIEVMVHNGNREPFYRHYVVTRPDESGAWFWSAFASVVLSDAAGRRVDLWVDGRVLEFRYADGSRKKYRRLPE